MTRRVSILIFAAWAFATLGGRWVCRAQFPAPGEFEVPIATPEAGGEHLRLETEFGPVHLWRPENYDASTAGTVVYIHGYFTSADQTWSDDHLAAQFHASARNALFLAIEAPQSNGEDVSWKSLDDLLHAVAGSTTFDLPHGPLVIVGHSGAYRTILLWLRDPRVRYVILLDGLYGGQGEFRSWLRNSPSAKPHRMVLVGCDTWRQSNRFARRVSGTARRRSIPLKSSTFTPRETRARLLYLRSQYEHSAIISSGKVIPVLLGITPIIRMSDADVLRAAPLASPASQTIP